MIMTMIMMIINATTTPTAGITTLPPLLLLLLPLVPSGCDWLAVAYKQNAYNYMATSFTVVRIYGV